MLVLGEELFFEIPDLKKHKHLLKCYLSFENEEIKIYCFVNTDYYNDELDREEFWLNNYHGIKKENIKDEYKDVAKFISAKTNIERYINDIIIKNLKGSI
jgi:hypothetical protein